MNLGGGVSASSPRAFGVFASQLPWHRLTQRASAHSPRPPASHVVDKRSQDQEGRLEPQVHFLTPTRVKALKGNLSLQ